MDRFAQCSGITLGIPSAKKFKTACRLAAARSSSARTREKEPVMAKMIFVNLPVSDLARATAFYQAIGARKEPAILR